MELALKMEILKKFSYQHAFAREAGVHESKLSAVIRGRRQLSAVERANWARLLDVPVEQIFPEESE